jgi:uncharacterized protein YndB with AHSA1/START domain
MVTDRIEREVLIDAPVEVVWTIVTEPEHMVRWFSDAAEVDLRPGGDLLLRFGEGATGVGTVERVERPHLFSFRWVSPEPGRDMAAAAGHFTLVEFLLRAEGEGTRLRVVESGFAGLEGTAEENAALAERHTGGWGTFLDRLAALASSADVSAPR